MNMRYDSGTITVVGDRVERLHEVATHAVRAGGDAAKELAGGPGDAPVHPHRPLHLLLLAVAWGRGPGGRCRGYYRPAVRGGEAGPQRRDGQDGGGCEVPGQSGGGLWRRGSWHFLRSKAKLRTAVEVRAKQEWNVDTAARGAATLQLAEIFLLPQRFVTFHTPVRLGSLSSADTR
jgi:hypothetical protein